MRQERLRVLDLLDEGKITAEEATKILEAMKGFKEHESDRAYSGDADEKLKNFTKQVDHYAREFGYKVQTAYKHVEPKLKKASQKVLEKTAAVFDDISKSINESLENARAAAARENEEECSGGNTCGEGEVENREN